MYRPSTPSELRRIGTPHRIAGSKWYRSSNVPCVYPSNKQADWRQQIRAARAALERRLAAAPIPSLKGDGKHAREAIAKLPMGRYSTGLGIEPDDDLKIALVEARYHDWLQQKGTTMTSESPSPQAIAFVGRIVAAQNTPITHGGADEASPVKPAKPAKKPVKAHAAAAQNKTAAAAEPNPPRVERPEAAAVANGAVKFAEAFSRTFVQLLGPHGYKSGASQNPEVLVFSKDGTLVKITNPSRPGGSKLAPFKVTRDGDATIAGIGRDALADALSVPRLARS